MILDRKQKPVPASSIDFVPPEIEEFKLSNGLRVFYIFKDKLPLIRMNLLIDAGSKFDPEDKQGLAYLTSLVLDEGAGELNALELSDEFDLLGSSFSISTDNDSITFSLQCLSENFDRSFELFTKVLLQPAFNSADFEREKKKLLTRIIQSKDEPDFIAEQIFDKILFGKSNVYSNPVLGYEETVTNISETDVKVHYHNYFSPDNSFLVLAGNLSKNELEIYLDKYLNKWNNLSIKSTLLFDLAKQKKRIYLYHKDGSVQTEIRVGQMSEKRNVGNYYSKLLFNSILGGQFTSRINLNLREKNGYTYGAGSRFQYLKDAGIFQVSTSVAAENTSNALKEIFFELDNIKKGITDEELEFAKSSITKKFPMNFETYRQIVFNVSSKILFNLPDDYFKSYINKINNTSKIEVEEEAKKSINPDETIIILVGDKNLIKDQIKNLKLEVIEVDIKGNLVL